MSATHVNPSGLSAAHRIEARDLAVRAAVLGRQREASLSYTQDWKQRWEGINGDLKAWRGETPRHADCSAFYTWCIWNGLDHFGVKDIVNKASWKAGYTGTMSQTGHRVTNGHLLRADCVLYGDPFGRTGHVAIYVGGGKVISFGGEPGPRLLDWNYRPVTMVRRHI
jgi:cell wall-associated NlpC family hydrolase